MKTCDHSLLGKYILKHTQNTGILYHKNAFLIGCVEPDYNYITYLRGSLSHKNLLGHHTTNSSVHIGKIISRLMTNGIYSTYDCFVLGTLIHYISDSFTYPHTPQFNKPFSQHGKCENRLHRHFAKAVENDIIFSDRDYENPLSMWNDCQKKYLSLVPSVSKDIKYILSVCLCTVNLIPIRKPSLNVDFSPIEI